MSFFNRNNLKARIDQANNNNKKVNKKERREELERCLETNTKLPHNLRKDAKNILDDVIYNDSEEKVYSWPNVFVTTSHGPSSFLKEFAKHFSIIFNGKFVSRAKMTNEELADYAHKNDITHLFILNESKGNISTIILSVFPYGKTYSFNVCKKAYKRAPTMKENVYLICDGFKSEKIGLGLHFDIRRIFPAIKSNHEKDRKYRQKNKNCRVVAFVNKGGTIIFKHYFVENRKFELDMALDLNLYKVNSGTFEMEGDVEYQINGYKNIINYDVL